MTSARELGEFRTGESAAHPIAARIDCCALRLSNYIALQSAVGYPKPRDHISYRSMIGPTRAPKVIDHKAGATAKLVEVSPHSDGRDENSR